MYFSKRKKPFFQMFLVHSAHIHNSMEGEVSFLCTFCDEIKLFLAGIMFSLLDMVNLSAIKL